MFAGGGDAALLRPSTRAAAAGLEQFNGAPRWNLEQDRPTSVIFDEVSPALSVATARTRRSPGTYLADFAPD
jgi:hypothetical protein